MLLCCYCCIIIIIKISCRLSPLSPLLLSCALFGACMRAWVTNNNHTRRHGVVVCGVNL